MTTTASVNFAFLADHDAVLAEYAAEAEAMFRDHPRSSITTLRTLAEALAKQAAAYSGVYVVEREELGLLLGRLRDRWAGRRPRLQIHTDKPPVSDA